MRRLAARLAGQGGGTGGGDAPSGSSLKRWLKVTKS
jgi:hypothetical protein